MPEMTAAHVAVDDDDDELTVAYEFRFTAVAAILCSAILSQVDA